jgi:hypothetical protein
MKRFTVAPREPVSVSRIADRIDTLEPSGRLDAVRTVARVARHS